MSKKIIALALIAAIIGIVGVSAQAKPKDGFYYAESAKFDENGWKSQVVLEVKGGKIVSANWNGVGNQAQEDKKTFAAAGKYGVIKLSKIGKEWHEQAAAVEKYLLDTQDVNFSKLKPDGTTDAITGASIHVKEFFDLAKAAVAASPVEKGSYKKDGWFFAKADKFDSNGYATTALITIVNGRIVNANWNAVYKQPGDSKYIRSVKGQYMKGTKGGEWHIQAAKVEAALVKQQDLAKLAVKKDGTTDAVSGVSITVNEFVEIANAALNKAK